MAIEVKDILTSLGVENPDLEKLTLDEFKTHVSSKYVLRDEVLKDETIKNKFTGTVLGKLSTKAAQEFGLTSGEVKDKSMEDIFGLAKTKYETQIADLSKRAGEGNDKKVEEALKAKLELEVKLKNAEEGLQTWEQKFNTEVADREGKLKEYKLNDKISKVKSSLTDKFTEEYKKDELKRAGFESHINSTYIFELDEKEEPVVKLRADGSIVKSTAKIGHSATPDEIFLKEMEAKGVLKKNNGKEKNIIPTFTPDKDKGNSGLHPKFLERVGG